jgi:pimeloyl-ACP methyl ester carboxylesterase
MTIKQLLAHRDGVDLFMTDRDGTGSPVVILHGLAGSSLELEDTASALAPHRVVTLDSRGHGRSTRRPDDVSREAHVADVVHVLETVVNEPVTLVGQSMGGHTALLVAAARPDLVSRLVLLEAGAGGDGTAATRKAMYDYFASWPRPFADRGQAAFFLGDSAIGRAWLADLEEREDGWWPRFDADIMIATIEHVDAEARWPEWSRIEAVTLIVFAPGGMFDAAARDEIVSKGRHVERVDLDAGSHDAHLDAFPQWIIALNDFFKRSAN